MALILIWDGCCGAFFSSSLVVEEVWSLFCDMDVAEIVVEVIVLLKICILNFSCSSVSLSLDVVES
jgi:hypothetical protein